MNRLEVCEKADITPRQLDHWTKNGWLTTDGNGQKAYRASEVRVAKYIRRLLNLGFVASMASRLAREIENAARASGKQTVWLDVGEGCMIMFDADI